jgi:hypothetical protein
MKLPLWIGCFLGLVPVLAAEEAGKAAAAPAGHVFAWPFLDWEAMRPQGGTTSGADVSLRDDPKEAWTRIWQPGLEKFERDRRAILALAGSYRVSFDFIETLGFTPGYKPPRPYFSWATEQVDVIEDRGEFISLQHALVMFFKDAGGEMVAPQVMKHWREDWTWQDPEILTYTGPQTWTRVASASPQGRWSQAVFQVDDSPRYEVMGGWTHVGGLSTWHSDNAPRPLPRREFSTRSDYNILEGTHEVTLAPTGWLHVQNNRKLRLDTDGTRTYVGTEIGVNRYEEITAPELAPAWKAAWQKSAPYWAAVRAAWAEVARDHKSFSIRDEVDGQKLFQIHFARAAAIEEAPATDAAADAAHAKETVRRFVK